MKVYFTICYHVPVCELKQTLSKTIQLTLDCGKPTAINRNSVIYQFLTDLAPLADREYSSNL